jgi:hypothetical protein
MQLFYERCVCSIVPVSKPVRALQCDKDLISQSVIWDNVKPNQVEEFRP